MTTADHRLEPGAVLGDFRLVRFIAHGGFGQVWDAEQISLRRRVALKLLRGERALTENQLELFRREARAGGKLSHPCLVPVFAWGQIDGIPYLAQELVGDGTTLAGLIEQQRQQDELPDDWYPRMARFFADAAEALAVVHDAGVIHRDLKPSNILPGADGRPRIVDFGLAKLLDQASLSSSGVGRFMGTYAYMSPEQALAKRVGLDHRTDVFSLGATFYEALTLRPAFTGDTPQQVTDAVVFAEPPEPRQVRSRIPRDLSVICMKSLEKRRHDRYAGMSELAADLRRFLADEPIVARPAGPLLRARKWTRRHPVASAVGAVGVLALVVISALAVYAIGEAFRADLNAAGRQVETTRAVRSEQDARAQAERADRNAAEAQASTDRALAEAARADRSAAEAQANADRALDEAARADQERDRVLRLAALAELEFLERQAEQLRPQITTDLGVYDEWLRRAQVLVAGLDPSTDGRDPGHRAALAALIERAEPGSDGSPGWESSDDARLAASLETLVSRLEPFADEQSGLWRGTQRKEWSVQRRRGAIAGSVDALDHPRWPEAIASIADRAQCPAYDGLAITPQAGLVPVGRDPDSGLWEFWHPLTGYEPLRDDSGRLQLTGDAGVVLVLLPGGTFLMGSAKGDEDSIDIERPQHEVRLSPFFMARTECTQGQWTVVMDSNPSTFTATGPAAPVEQVSWNDIQGFEQKTALSLPSEAQWEYAARAGTTGARHGDLDTIAWHSGNSGNTTHPVGQALANAFGLHDMIGNVWEWCEDTWHDSYAGAPSNGAAWVDNGAAWVDGSSYRVIRGGSWYYVSRYCRSALRFSREPGYRYSYLGFRPSRPLR